LKRKYKKFSKAFKEEQNLMKKLLYVCEADSGGIMEYAIWQAAAISRWRKIFSIATRNWSQSKSFERSRLNW
jgi:hypothetical protein